MRMEWTGRSGLPPASRRLGALILNDFGDREHEIKPAKGTGDEPATASAVSFEHAEHKPVEPFCPGG